jgi:CRISPR-associated protein Cas2
MLMVLFDLPTETRVDRKRYSKFRDSLLDDGFVMLQFSIYIRHCSSRENMLVHIKRVRENLPANGKIAILPVTDKQFEKMETYYDGTVLREQRRGVAMQLEIF